MNDAVYRPDLSLLGKLRRRAMRLYRRRRVANAPSRAMLTFSFDDVPRSATTTGAATLEAVGARASFYACAGLVDDEGAIGRHASREDLRRLAARGHEIGCHTYSHLDCGRAPAEQVSVELDKNAARLMEWGLPKPRTFAYPYGDVGPAVKSLAQRRFLLARGVHRGDLGLGSDLTQAPAVNIDGPRGEAAGRAWMERAARHERWLILFGHAVQESAAEFAVAPDALRRLADQARALNLDIVTASEGAERLRALPK